MKYVRNNVFRPMPSIDNFEQLNELMVQELEADLDNRRLADGRTVRQAWQAERQHLRPLPAHPPPSCRTLARVVDKFGHVRVDGAHYSVPIRHAYRPAWVKLYHDRVEVAVADEVVAKHARSFRQGAKVLEPPHLPEDLRTLYLTSMASQWRTVAEQARSHRQPYAEFLADLARLEVTGRRERRIQRRVKEARFPMLKTLDAFQFEAQPTLDRDEVLELFRCEWVREAANVVFVGSVGTGKTHLAITLGMACCQQDYRVKFTTAAELTNILVEAKQDGRLSRKLEQMARYDVVILDELGYVPFDKQGADLLFRFITRVYERRSVVVTTNLPFAKWSRGVLGCHGGRCGDRPDRAPRYRAQDRRQQLPTQGR